MLSIRKVSKSYRRGEIKAVDDLSLEVPAGQIFGFLGPNGAGKTTTIKMVVGLLRPDSGTITVDGVDVQARPLEAKRRIGFVPDYPELYEKLTGLEYLNFIGDVFGVPTDIRRSRLGELLEMFDLRDAVRELVQTFSHGMRQKLAVIAAVLPDPKLLILDEPMTGLDPRSAALFKELMRQRCDQGKAVFFSTHVLDVAERVCDRIAIINRGRLVAEGSMEELRRLAAGEATLERIFLEVTEEKPLEEVVRRPVGGRRETGDRGPGRASDRGSGPTPDRKPGPTPDLRRPEPTADRRPGPGREQE